MCSRIAGAFSAIASVTALDAKTSDRIAIHATRTMAVDTTLHAARPIRSADLMLGTAALTVFVARDADSAAFVASVRFRGTIGFLATDWHATLSYAVTPVALGAIASNETFYATVPLGVTTLEDLQGAVLVHDALYAAAGRHVTVQTSQGTVTLGGARILGSRRGCRDGGVRTSAGESVEVEASFAAERPESRAAREHEHEAVRQHREPQRCWTRRRASSRAKPTGYR